MIKVAPAVRTIAYALDENHGRDFPAPVSEQTGHIESTEERLAMDYLRHAKALKDEIRATVISYLEVNNIPLSAVIVKVDEGSPSKSSIEIQFKPMGRDQLLENRFKFPLLIETDDV